VGLCTVSPLAGSPGTARSREWRFDGCNLGGADFGAATLRSVHFIACDFGQAEFHGTSMKDVAFEGCPALGSISGAESLSGAHIDCSELIDLAPALGIPVSSAG
jgi:uncharacterized protein YjbI with pentapeptide repeats